MWYETLVCGTKLRFSVGVFKVLVTVIVHVPVHVAVHQCLICQKCYTVFNCIKHMVVMHP